MPTYADYYSGRQPPMYYPTGSLLSRFLGAAARGAPMSAGQLPTSVEDDNLYESIWSPPAPAVGPFAGQRLTASSGPYLTGQMGAAPPVVGGIPSRPVSFYSSMRSAPNYSMPMRTRASVPRPLRMPGFAATSGAGQRALFQYSPTAAGPLFGTGTPIPGKREIGDVYPRRLARPMFIPY